MDLGVCLSDPSIALTHLEAGWSWGHWETTRVPARLPGRPVWPSSCDFFIKATWLHFIQILKRAQIFMSITFSQKRGGQLALRGRLETLSTHVGSHSLLRICHLMRCCIVDKCTKPEGSNDSCTFWCTETGSNKKLLKVGIKRLLQHHTDLTAEVEPYPEKQPP